MPEEKTPEINEPKARSFNFSSWNWANWNFRRFNWITALGILAYLNVLVLIPLFAGRRHPFVTFHVRQGLLLLFVWIAFVYSFYLPYLPIMIGLYLLYCFVSGVVSVAMGHERPLPWIGKIVE